MIGSSLLPMDILNSPKLSKWIRSGHGQKQKMKKPVTFRDRPGTAVNLNWIKLLQNTMYSPSTKSMKEPKSGSMESMQEIYGAYLIDWILPINCLPVKIQLK